MTLPHVGCKMTVLAVLNSCTQTWIYLVIRYDSQIDCLHKVAQKFMHCFQKGYGYLCEWICEEALADITYLATSI